MITGIITACLKKIFYNIYCKIIFIIALEAKSRMMKKKSHNEFFMAFAVWETHIQDIYIAPSPITLTH